MARFTNVGIIGSPGMSYTLTYSAPGLTSATQNITLAGPALPTVSFTAAGQTVSEGDGTATITARLSGSSNQPVTENPRW